MDGGGLGSGEPGVELGDGGGREGGAVEGGLEVLGGLVGGVRACWGD